MKAIVGVEMGFCLGAGVVSRIISDVDRLPGIAPVSHVFWKFLFDKEDHTEALIYESHLSGGVQITPWTHFMRAKRLNKIIAYESYDVGLSTYQAQQLWHTCAALMHKEGYDVKRILGYLLWIKLARRKP